MHTRDHIYISIGKILLSVNSQTYRFVRQWNEEKKFNTTWQPYNILHCVEVLDDISRIMLSPI